jgi:hypothetical protein
MKKFSVSVIILLVITMFSTSCTNSANSDLSPKASSNLVADKETVNKLINALDATIIEGKKLKTVKNTISEEYLRDMFLVQLSKEGIEATSATPQNYSKTYLSYIQSMPSSDTFTNVEDFVAHLRGMQKQCNSVLTSDLEIQDFLDKSEFMIQFTTYLKNNQSSFGVYGNKCDGWWGCWGKCAAGIVGGVLTGGLGGAAVGSVVPVLGTAWGAAIGVVGGGLTGAAASCG